MDRFTLLTGSSPDRMAAFARDVRAGLESAPKRLSCCFFYDQRGSELFEAITELQEYYLTRAEREILEARADEIVGRTGGAVTLVELGSGSALKTRLIIDALLRRQEKLRFVPVDICSAMLRESSLRLVRDYPRLEVTAIAAEYREGLTQLAELAGPKLILWLGSNVGNYHRAEAGEFLRQVRLTMTPADRFLVGVDLRKDKSELEPAYDDAQKVTAEFNLNLLTRINRELGGHFDFGAFAHRAIYNQEVGRVEMYLVSLRAQRVRIDAFDTEHTFAAGEAIHTENSYKYSAAEIDALAAAGLMQVEARWLDGQGRFSVNLLAPC